MSRILAFVDWYLPGYRAGGPVRSVARLIEVLSDEHQFFVFTRDRDIGDVGPYAGIEPDVWLERGRTRVYYASPARRGIGSILRRIREVQPDIIYLNSFFSRLTVRVLLLRRCGVLGAMPVIVAPRGEFSPGALGLKARRKFVYRVAARLLRLYTGVLWHASTQEEAALIRREMGDVPCMVAPDLPVVGGDLPQMLAARPTKPSGCACFVYLSRIHPMKNLLYLLEALGGVEGCCELHVYGPIADAKYMARCKEVAAALPEGITWHYAGEVVPDEVISTLARYHFMVLPTLGENFGHVIIEALAAGCPVIISDRTPWHHLEETGAGWEVPLEEPQRWVATLQHCIEMAGQEYEARSLAARRYARDFAGTKDLVAKNRELFRQVVARRRQ